MKKQLLLPLAAVAGGAAAFALRLLQNRTGFELGTGLPIPGNLPGIALAALLAALGVVLAALAGHLPKESAPGPAFPADFTTGDTRLLLLPVAGVFLLVLSGAADLFLGLGFLGQAMGDLLSAADPSGMTSVVVLTSGGGFSPRIHVLLGLLTLASAAGLALCAAACRRADPPRTVSGNWLLLMVANLVIRLVLTYRIDSVNPALAAYCVELLALVFLTLAFYRLSSFAFQAGQTRRFALYTGAAAVLSLASLADSGPAVSSLLLYTGSTAYLLGLLALRLLAPAAEPGPEDQGNG
ncbi:hypothetical protein [uncultured Oscillibacter sp.]|uniref:hypothetical protein n=1 Tax=uncultured Oscillibacter sp. TaxID=876091 RepID=UPI0025D2A8E9|nr:hypothetical protein [uncultured Oscillibacter sp.]